MGSVGMLGDLAESLLKRDVGCKDSSAWMPGFGGVLGHPRFAPAFGARRLALLVAGNRGAGG